MGPRNRSHSRAISVHFHSNRWTAVLRFGVELGSFCAWRELTQMQRHIERRKPTCISFVTENRDWIKFHLFSSVFYTMIKTIIKQLNPHPHDCSTFFLFRWYFIEELVPELNSIAKFNLIEIISYFCQRYRISCLVSMRHQTDAAKKPGVDRIEGSFFWMMRLLTPSDGKICYVARFDDYFSNSLSCFSSEKLMNFIATHLD